MSEMLNRGYNLLATCLVAVPSIAFTPEMFIEDEPLARVDDGILLLLAIFAIWRYRFRGNKFRRSITPIFIATLALGLKVFAIIVEHDDTGDLGDDFGGIILFGIALVVIVYQYYRTKKLIESYR